MKKWKSALCFFALMLCFTCALTTESQAKIKLNKSSLTLLEGESATLKLTGTKKNITWKSNAKTVATVSKKGKVTAKAPGQAVISATVGKTTKKCKVSVEVNYANIYEYQVKYGKVTINKLLRISESELAIPETIEGYPVTELADGLFKDCDGLVSISIPAGVTRIGNSLFSGCHMLQEVNCTGAITEVGSYAFYECRELKTLPDLSKISSIGEYTFYDCDSLTALSIPMSLTSVGNYAFFDCDKLLTFYAPDSLISVGDYAFKSCDELVSVNGFKNTQSLGTECFAECKKLGNASFGSKLTTMGAGCFSGCEKLGSISLPAMLTSIPDRCFYNCYAISNVTIPISVTRIGNQAFYNCIRLSILTIPGGSITSIAADSLAGVPISSLSVWYRSTSYMDGWVSGLGLTADRIHTI